MAVLVNFSSVTPLKEVLPLATNVSTATNLRLRVLPEKGNNTNGGNLSQAAKPVVEGMIDGNGFVLPQYARLYKVSADGNAIDGTDVPLTVTLQSSSFANGLPTESVFFDLLFDPSEELSGLTPYAFEYVQVLPGEWQDKNRLTYYGFQVSFI